MSAFGWCPHAEDHTSCPEGYVQWHAWAERMAKTHRQEKCGECGRWSIWVPEDAAIRQLSSQDEGVGSD